MFGNKIPEVVVKRLPIYMRVLMEYSRRDVETVSSQDMGDRTGINPAQIRKDLACFGEFGKPGVGYDVEYLLKTLREILGLNEELPVVLVGMGNLGRAFCRYNRERSQGLRIRAVFDSDPEKIGLRVAGLEVKPVESLRRVVDALNARIGMITVPASEAQNVANSMIEAGIKGILNFAPVALETPEDVRLHTTDFTLELQSLAYYVANAERP